MQAAVVPALLVIVTFLSVLLRKWRPEYALAVSLTAGLAVLLAAGVWLRPLIEQAQQWLRLTGLPDECAAALYKGAGVCLLTTLAADTCRDAGEAALASGTETAGKILLLVLALPLLQQVGSLAFSLLTGAAV